MRYISKLYLVLLSMLFCVACDTKPKKYKNAAALEKGDAQFLALKDTAQSHLQEFIDSLALYGMDRDHEFQIKSDFVEGETHEHMWSTINSYKDGKFYGRFIDSAYEIKNIQHGDSVVVIKQDLEDWVMYNTKVNSKIGSFSSKYIRSKMK